MGSSGSDHHVQPFCFALDKYSAAALGELYVFLVPLCVVSICPSRLIIPSKRIPLNTLTVVTGVSGSGKSSLITEVLYKRVHKELHGGKIYAESDMKETTFSVILPIIEQS